MILIATVLFGAAGVAPILASADEPGASPLPAGAAARGKAIYHGKGGCAFCHGTDGYAARKPRKTDLHTEAIAKLDPPPTDLRNAAALKSKDDAQRFQSIKFGHPGTAMLPRKTQLTDGDIADVLAYLAILRAEGSR
jgi:mono/diheme cytochrome c family protein